MENLGLILFLGLLLGVRHALDADHLVAVSTIVSEYKNPLRAIWIGVSWGLGHTTTLFLAGIAILFLKISLPERLTLFFEFLVGIMLVLLGIQIFWSFRKKKVHLHPHESSARHGGSPLETSRGEPLQETGGHRHFHSHEEEESHGHHRLGFNNLASFLIAGILPGEHGSGKIQGPGKPFFRLKSYIVGTVHGLAGSAALLLLVLASLKSTWAGVVYILLFGLGSVVSMGLITIGISLPFAASSRLPRLNYVVQGVAGFLSIVFGIMLMYKTGIVEGLFG